MERGLSFLSQRRGLCRGKEVTHSSVKGENRTGLEHAFSVGALCYLQAGM